MLQIFKNGSSIFKKKQEDILKHREATTNVINNLVISLYNEVMKEGSTGDDW